MGVRKGRRREEGQRKKREVAVKGRCVRKGRERGRERERRQGKMVWIRVQERFDRIGQRSEEKESDEMRERRNE
jgi:hypothetical protein